MSLKSAPLVSFVPTQDRDGPPAPTGGKSRAVQVRATARCIDRTIRNGQDALPPDSRAGLFHDRIPLETRIRRRDRRSGLCRHVHAALPARARLLGAGLRGRQRCRRHLVLEPLSRRALRCREPAIFLFLLRGTGPGVGVDREIRPAAGNPGLCQPCGGPVRPQARHPLRHQGDGARVRRSRETLECRDGRRPMLLGPILHHGGRLPLGGQPAPFRRARPLRGRGAAYRRVAA